MITVFMRRTSLLGSNCKETEYVINNVYLVSAPGAVHVMTCVTARGMELKQSQYWFALHMRILIIDGNFVIFICF